MRRADRLFQIVGILSRRRFATAQMLAEQLEVSVRTVYRDVLDLCASGVPIAGEPGVGYRLDSSYRLPPLMFSADEVEALVIGMRMVEAWGDKDLRTSARAILDKVDAVVSDKERTQLKSTALFSLSFGTQRQATQHLGELRAAVNGQQEVRFAYSTAQEQQSIRTVRPLGLYFWGRTWTLAAWCTLRNDFRNFRLDRMSDVELTEDHFELTSPHTLDDYVAAMQARDET